MFKKFSFLLSILVLFVNVGVNAQLDRDIVIFYENDVHCEMSGYAKLSAMRDEAATNGEYTALVSCGDFVQGGPIGAYSLGDSIIQVMNKMEYDVVTIGNHEFDYGIPQLNLLLDKLTAKTVCSNFIDLKTNKSVYDPYTIIEYGDTKVAYVGCITPGTITSSTPIFFMENGEYVYSFAKDTIYENIQDSVNSAREEGADYVILLSHLGDIVSNSNITSISLIENTTGIDVVIDSHAHSVITDSVYKNKEGKDVILTSSGTKFANIGKVVISPDDGISAQLIPTTDITIESEAVKSLVDEFKIEDYVVGSSAVELNDSNEQGLRMTRRKETGLGNFVADAFRVVADTDIAMINGGGIRASLPEGELKFSDIYKMFPFENVPYCVNATGQKVLDLLEYSLARYPYEFGGFMNVSGVRFKINPSIKSCVVRDGDGMFVKFEGERRVCDVEVLNKQTNIYEPIDVNKTYTVSTLDYSARKSGDGNSLFLDCEKINEGGMLDTDLIAMYIKDYCNGIIPKNYGQTEGRITLVDEALNNLPLRKTFENLDYTVDWSADAPDDVTVTFDGRVFKFSDNSKYMTYNDTQYDLSLPTYIDETDTTRVCPIVVETVTNLYLLSLK